ncbi:hypothetical protein DET55_14517 [Bacillus mycoides]|uniref:Uncharacterized protein n=1 Tax=Bacillus mycoides TaxID=1405 RepID=A0A3D9TKM9_BACMY|nr:hypothetical protein DET63_110207 [Bacillus sp. DB-2]REF17666.1 hypothetical protein DET55_14517 [Bacillus mycoides]
MVFYSDVKKAIIKEFKINIQKFTFKLDGTA